MNKINKIIGKQSCIRIKKFVYFTGFLDLFGASLIIPLLIVHTRELGLSYLAIGVVSSLYGILQLLSSPLIGWWSDIWGRKPVLLICLFATSFSYGVLGSSNTLAFIILGRCLAGIFKHSQTVSRAYLSDMTDSSELSKVYGAFNAYSSMGFIVGPVIGGHLTENDKEYGFMKVCSIGAILFLLNFVLSYLFLPNYKSKGNDEESKDKTEVESLLNIKKFSKDIDWSVFWDIFLLRFLLSFSIIIFRYSFSPIIEERFGFSPKIIGYIIATQGIISAITGLFTGRISKCFQYVEEELFVGSCILTLILFSMTTTSSFAILILCLVPLCVSSTIVRVAGSIITTNRTKPEMVGSITGFGQSMSSISRMIAPMMAGLVLDLSVIGPGIMSTVSATLGTAIAYYLYRQKKYKDKED